MITVKDLVAYQKMLDASESKQVDEWLKIKVFPSFTHNNQGYEVPSWCTGSKLKTHLEARGFSVETNSSHQGSFVYLTIPPQGDCE